MKNEAQEEWIQIENAKHNPQCFESLYIKYYEKILKFVYSRMDSLDDAYEITASTFSKALSNIGKYQYQGLLFSSWLHRIAINEINQYYRDTKKNRTINIDDAHIKYIQHETGKETQELYQALKIALQYLNLDEIQLLELRFYEEHSFSEVAEILGITENNAKVKTYRVIAKLKVLFKKVC
jgi:RNA polymerase sigma-70 factor (ECF subfamily)